MKSIEIIVSPTGDISIDAVGFKGADCEQATRFIEEALGSNTRRVKKPEYQARRTSHQQQGLGS
jgi:hypothetical protein